jgi:YjbE family integral membrane protein
LLDILSVVGGILLVDLILSGDNALVIGAIAAGLQRRRLAVLLGGGAAIVLRLVFAILTTLLLQLPLLQALGGFLLLLIAIRLLAARREKMPAVKPSLAQTTAAKETTDETLLTECGKPGGRQPAPGLLPAVLTILAADVTMSLDNVLAVGGLARGNLTLLTTGIVFSVIILLFGSALVSELIGLLPWLLDGAALVLAWAGANMILNDLRLGPLLSQYPWTQLVIPVVAFAIVLLADVLLRLHESRSTETEQA